MRLKPLVAAVAVGISALAAAPAAHAGWITGQGTLPVGRSDAVCRNGMDFQLATYQRPRLKLFQPDPVTFYDVNVSADASSGFVTLSPLYSASELAVPYHPIYVPEIAGSIDSWPSTPGLLTHYGQYTLRFLSRVAPGSHVMVQFRRTPTTPVNATTTWEFTVEDCWTAIEPIGIVG
jgi:hypothetical protein